MTVRLARVSGLVTVQDSGRVGLAHLGVPRAGALDQPAMQLANRLVGNDATAAVLEITTGRVSFTADRAVSFAVTGARCEILAAGRPQPWGEAVTVASGALIEVGMPIEGVRCYLAFGGGLLVDPVLGSRSTDTLAWIGPPVVTDGTVLPVGDPPGPPAPYDAPRWVRPRSHLRVAPGPRPEWFAADALARLCSEPYVVAAASNRIGLRLSGAPVPRARADELPSEGMVTGAIQVPPDGQPVVLLHDHPTTGGYPVVGVVWDEDLARCAQLAPGDEVRFTPAAAVL